MKSKWKTSSNYIGRTIWQVYRTLDIDAVDHAGNREYCQEVFENDQEAKTFAEKLNSQEEKSDKND